MGIVIAVVVGWLLLSIPVSVVLGLMLRQDDSRFPRWESDDVFDRRYDRPRTFTA